MQHNAPNSPNLKCASSQTEDILLPNQKVSTKCWCHTDVTLHQFSQRSHLALMNRIAFVSFSLEQFLVSPCLYNLRSVGVQVLRSAGCGSAWVPQEVTRLAFLGGLCRSDVILLPLCCAGRLMGCAVNLDHLVSLAAARFLHIKTSLSSL